LNAPEELLELLQTAFSTEQLAAIAAPLEPVLIEAGAGSGKTAVMAARVVWLVASGRVEPDQVLGLTFTRKAAHELADRIGSALTRAGWSDSAEVSVGEPVIATYDAFAAALVRDYGVWAGRDRPSRPLDEGGRHRLAGQTVAEWDRPLTALSRFSPTALTARVLALDAAMTAHLVDAATLRRHCLAERAAWAEAPPGRQGPTAAVAQALDTIAARLELLELRQDYRQRKAAAGRAEFADQMAQAIDLVRSQPQVGRDLRRRFAVVLVDEYQDTSSAQAALLRDLFGAGLDPAGAGFPVTAVGDPRQAIYGWRGASAANLADFCRDFTDRAGAVARRQSLSINRRSDRLIVAAANRVAALLSDAASVAAAEPLRCAATAGPGLIETAGFSTWPEEVAWVADRVASALDRGEARAWGQIAVLTRGNAEARALWSALDQRDVPVELVGLGGLLDLPELASLVAHLRLIDQPASNPDLVTVLTGPQWRFSRLDLDRLGRRARQLAAASSRPGPAGPDDPGQERSEPPHPPPPDESAGAVRPPPRPEVDLMRALADPGPAFAPAVSQRLAACWRQLNGLARHRLDPVVDLVERVVARTGLEAESASRPEAVGRVRRGHLNAFREAVANFAADEPTAGLSGLVAYLEAEQAFGGGLERAEVSPQDSVKLITMHRAKGLEWDVVYLPALVGNVFPNSRVTDDPLRNPAALPHALRGDRTALPRLERTDAKGIAQFGADLRRQALLAEHRLAYVALTRARHRLIASAHHWAAGLARPRPRSAYFDLLLAMAPSPGPGSDLPALSTDAVNPIDLAHPGLDWPELDDPDAAERLLQARQEVVRLSRDRSARRQVELDLAQAPVEVRDQVRGWDQAIAQALGAAATASGRTWPVELPVSLSASQVLWAQRDPAGLAAALARPLPRPPAPAQRRGDRFHDWVRERLGRPALLDPWDWSDPAAEAEADSLDGGLDRELRQRFSQGRFGQAQPCAVERSFALVLGGRIVRGRIDAVYARADASDLVPVGADFLVLDWKTGQAQPDPAQLAWYRLAWAERAGVALERVAAGFYHVGSDRLEMVQDLPDRAGLTAALEALGG
jgi:DNA helicase-2/ATP-dependent DNA helicase PcrA